MQKDKTALTLAASRGRLRIVELLIEHGANKDHLDKVKREGVRP